MTEGVSKDAVHHGKLRLIPYTVKKLPVRAKTLPLMRCFIANKELKATRGAIEITHARPAKEFKPKAQNDFRRLLLGELVEIHRNVC